MEPNARNQTLTCQDCGSTFQRRSHTGRTPKRCPKCADQAVANHNSRKRRNKPQTAQQTALKRGPGQPSPYQPQFAEEAKNYYAQGATDAEVADLFGVDIRSVKRWIQQQPEFRTARKTAKSVADQRVQQSLYNRAVGYEFEAEKVFFPAQASAPVKVTYREHVPPETTACIFWLKNRRPDLWRDKVESTGKVEHHHHHGGDPKYREAPDHELERMVKAARQPTRADDDAKPTTH